jgi:hypothetical protein
MRLHRLSLRPCLACCPFPRLAQEAADILTENRADQKAFAPDHRPGDRRPGGQRRSDGRRHVGRPGPTSGWLCARRMRPFFLPPRKAMALRCAIWTEPRRDCREIRHHRVEAQRGRARDDRHRVGAVHPVRPRSRKTRRGADLHRPRPEAEALEPSARLACASETDPALKAQKERLGTLLTLRFDPDSCRPGCGHRKLGLGYLGLTCAPR